jgi:hypothetical protein
MHVEFYPIETHWWIQMNKIAKNWMKKTKDFVVKCVKCDWAQS